MNDLRESKRPQSKNVILPPVETKLAKNSPKVESNSGDLIYRQEAIDTIQNEVEPFAIIDPETNYVIGISVKEADVIRTLEKLPPAQVDLSGYSDRLWRTAYERGKAEAQAESCEYYALCRHGRDENKLRARLGFCEYCNEDADGFVTPLEKNGHAFVRFGMNGWELDLKANGWHGSAKIRYCPMCGRDLLVK